MKKTFNVTLAITHKNGNEKLLAEKAAQGAYTLDKVVDCVVVETPHAALDFIARLSATVPGPVAYMTNDGRVSMRATVETVMPNSAKESFNIPLYTHPALAQPDQPDDLTIAYMSGFHDGKAQRQSVPAIAQSVQPSLQAAAQAVLDRWNSPRWEWATHGPTADLMHVLRQAITQSVPPAPERGNAMSPDHLQIGDTIEDSPAGAGAITGITEAGYPQVNHVAVACLRRTDGVVFDPYGKYAKEAK